MVSEGKGLLNKIAVEYRAVQQVSPEHELLQYAKLNGNGTPVVFSENSWGNFLKRFGASLTGSMESYCNALQGARAEGFRKEICTSYDVLKRIEPWHQLLSLVSPNDLENLTPQNWEKAFMKVRLHADEGTTLDNVCKYLADLKQAVSSVQK